MLGLLIPTVSSWFSQGSLANQVSGTSSSNLTGAGAGAAQSSITPTNGTQLASAFENLISQINAATQSSGASPATASAASTASASAASAPGQQAVHGRHHGHGGGANLSALLQQLDELATGSTTASGASSAGSTSSTTGSTAANGLSSTPSVSSASTTQIEATLNQLLQNLKLGGSSTNVAALNSATTAPSAQSLAQRFAQQGIQARAGHLLTAMA